MLKAKVHSAKVMDYEAIKELFPRPSHRWMDGGYNEEDKGGDWVEKTLGWTRWRSSDDRASLLPRMCSDGVGLRQLAQKV